MGQRFGGETEGQTTTRHGGGDRGGLRLFVGWLLFFYFHDVMMRLLFYFFFTHLASPVCIAMFLRIADLIVYIRCVFVRKGSIYSEKLELIMAVEFIFYLSEHMRTEKEMAWYYSNS